MATLMGHQRLNTTVIYTQPGARDLEQAVARLEHDNDLPPTTRRKGGEGWMINETNYQIEMCTDGKHRAIVTFEDPGGSKAAKPRLLRADSEDIAVLMPTPPTSSKRRGDRAHTEADHEAFRASAGGWKDVDTDKLIADIYESRSRSSRPPLDL